MEIALLTAAALCFACGGLSMKFANGISRPAPTALFLTLFAIGAILQSLALRRADLGVAYIIVLGLEAILTLVFSIWLLNESANPSRLLAVGLILAGVLLLRNR
jgi:small multidrug resistance pump/quaternary ammonium compound-resistance protein SugE